MITAAITVITLHVACSATTGLQDRTNRVQSHDATEAQTYYYDTATTTSTPAYLTTSRQPTV